MKSVGENEANRFCLVLTSWPPGKVKVSESGIKRQKSMVPISMAGMKKNCLNSLCIIVLIIIITTIIVIINIIIIIITKLKGTLWDFFLKSPHCTANCLHHVCLSGQGTVMCESRATHWVLIMCYMSCATMSNDKFLPCKTASRPNKTHYIDRCDTHVDP